MARMSQIEKNTKDRHIKKYPRGGFTVVKETILNSQLCREDPRRFYLCTHKMEEIIFLIFCAILSNCITFFSMAGFGKMELEWLRNYFPYEIGIPSHDTLRRVTNMICPSILQDLLISLLVGLQKEDISGSIKHIALDGKSIKGHYKTEGHRVLHSVSAFASELGLSLAQVITHNDEGKEEGEIQATKKLVDLIDCKGKVLTGDAGFCNREIAQAIVERNGDYIFQLKKKPT